MLRRRFFVSLSTASVPPEELRPHLPEHLRHMIGLEKGGVLFASGPFLLEGQPPGGAGHDHRSGTRPGGGGSNIRL